MKRLSLPMIAVALFASWILCTPSPSQAAEYTWKLGHEELPGGFMDAVAQEFAKLLSQKSNGKIKLDVYPSGTLGTSEDLVELTQQKAIQFNFADAGHLGTQIPQIQAMLLHYIFPSSMDATMKILRDGSFHKVLDPMFREKKLEPLCYLSEGWQVWSTNKLIRKPDDFKGFKMRTMSAKLIVENYAAYGANPTPVPFAEVYSALQLHMVDGQENPIFAIADMKFHEVQDYLIWGYTSPFILTLVSNEDFYKGLPEDIRKIVKDAAVECIPFGFKWQEEFNKSRLDEITKSKPAIKVVHLTSDEIAAFKEKAKPVRDVYLQIGGEGAKDVLDALEKDIQTFSK